MSLSIRPCPPEDGEPYRAAQLALFDELAAGTRATTVPLRLAYVDIAFCITLVHLLPPALSARIHDEVISPLRGLGAAHHWYPPSDLHLTLKNVQRAEVGRTHAADLVERARAAIARACRAIAPLEFDLLGPVCLPTSVVLRAIGTTAHRDAVRLLDRELAQAGVPDDKVYASTEVFLGNVTVCRYTAPPSPALEAAVARLRDRRVVTLAVGDAALVRCDEVCSSASRQVYGVFELPALAPGPRDA